MMPKAGQKGLYIKGVVYVFFKSFRCPLWKCHSVILGVQSNHLSALEAQPVFEEACVCVSLKFHHIVSPPFLHSLMLCLPI